MDKETDAEWFARIYATNSKFAYIQDPEYIWDANAAVDDKIKRGLVVYNAQISHDKVMIMYLRNRFKDHKEELQYFSKLKW